MRYTMTVLALVGLLFLVAPVEAGGYPQFAPQRQFAPAYAPAYAQGGICALQDPVYIQQQPVFVPRAPVIIQRQPAYAPSYGAGVGAAFQRTEIRERRGFLGRARSRSVQQIRFGGF